MPALPSKARIQIIPPYVGELRSKTGYYLGWIPNEYADQVSADNAYDLLKNDLAIAHALHLHACMAAGERWRFHAEDKRIVTILEKCIDRISDFMHARKSLIEGGMLFGLGIQRKYYETFEIREIPNLKWIGISRIEEVDRRRLRLERGEYDNTSLEWTIWDPRYDQYIKIQDRADNPLAPAGSGIQDYIWYFHEKEELNPYYRGLGQILYIIVFIKSKVLQYWADNCESWSKPWLVMAIDIAKGAINAAIGGDIKTASARVQEMLEVFEKARARHAIVVDKEDKIDFFEHGSTGTNILREFMNYADEKIQLLLLGAELTTGTGSGVGSYALGNVHRQQTETLILYSRNRLQEVLERDLIYDLLYRNRLNFYRLGMMSPEPGDVKLELYVKMEEKKEEALEKQLKGYRGDMEKII